MPMIEYIEGKIIERNLKGLVILTGGIGYKVSITPENLMDSEIGNNISLWIHQVIKEDSHNLYGFKNRAELAMFGLLISVSGIGPKTALNIMSLAPIEMLETAIASGETAGLIKIAGVNKKSAEKIVLELKGKVISKGDDKESLGLASADADVMEALKSLGYSGAQVREVLKDIGKDVKGAGARIKEALKMLGK